VADAALLIYDQSEQGKGSPSRDKARRVAFDHQLHMGERVTLDVLARAGIDVAYCSPATAHEHRVVLVGIPAVSSTLAFYRSVQGLATWRDPVRRFIVIAGGPGMVNPIAIRRFVDLAIFGRSEPVIVDLMRAAIAGTASPGLHVLSPRDPSPVSYAQVKGPYPHPVNIDGRAVSEGPIGCPRLCHYCQYRWTRRPSGHGERYSVAISTGGSAVETTADELGNVEPAPGKATIAVDGSSERLRTAIHKPITTAAWVDSFNRWTERRATAGKGSMLTVYNILGLPTETDADRDEFWGVWRGVARRTTKTSVEVRAFGFRAMPATPMQWEGVDLTHDWNRTIGGKRFVSEDNLVVVGSFGTSSPRMLVADMAILRALPTPESDRLIHALATSAKLRGLPSLQAVYALGQAFDLSPIVREYGLDEDLPTSWLTGVASEAALRKAARKMRERLHAGYPPGDGEASSTPPLQSHAGDP